MLLCQETSILSNHPDYCSTKLSYSATVSQNTSRHSRPQLTITNHLNYDLQHSSILDLLLYYIKELCENHLEDSSQGLTLDLQEIQTQCFDC